MTVRVAEFYSGIGTVLICSELKTTQFQTLHLAFKRSRVSGNVIRAFDWDPAACKVYEANNGSGVVETVSAHRNTSCQVLKIFSSDFFILLHARLIFPD